MGSQRLIRSLANGAFITNTVIYVKLRFGPEQELDDDQRTPFQNLNDAEI
jgi:hypothetical protein